jgi:hypothetical protein
VSHADGALLAQIADKSGLTQALSVRLARLKQRDAGHDPGRVVRDLAVMLADGGDCLADLGAVRDQDALFGAVASDSTAFRVIPGRVDAGAFGRARRRARPSAREQSGRRPGRPERVTIEVDGTLVTSHSEKEGAAGTYKGGDGFHPLMAYCDETGEALAALLRPGNAGSNTAADHIAVIQDTLAQVPAQLIETIKIVVRTDSAGATHEVMDFCREHRLRFSAGFELPTPKPAADRRTRAASPSACYRLLHVAARLVFQARTATLRIDANWPWADALSRVGRRLSRAPGFPLQPSPQEAREPRGRIGGRGCIAAPAAATATRRALASRARWRALRGRRRGRGAAAGAGRRDRAKDRRARRAAGSAPSPRPPRGRRPPRTALR